MKETTILPDHPAKYPYFSDIVKAGGTFVFVSAQAGRSEDGTWSGSFADQLDGAIANLRRTLAAAGASLDDVVQLAAFLSDARNGDADCRHGNVFNEVYSRHFTGNWPVRSRVQAVLHDPRCLVELDAFAVIDDGDRDVLRDVHDILRETAEMAAAGALAARQAAGQFEEGE